jgi:SAM-dependent methyltransferase
MTDKTFRDLEHEGWVDRAAVYRDVFGKITSQAIGPLLSSFGSLSGKRFLDVACGTGELTAAAASQGASAQGVDFAGSMIEKAASAHAPVRFHVGDAERLPFEPNSFDCVACAFGILHLEHPEAAVAEARRVLSHGGMYAFTTWCAPDQGGEFFKLVLGAVQQYGTLNVTLPPAPPMFRFADPGECKRVLEATGFVQPTTTVLHLSWRSRQATDLLNIIYKSAVRAALILQAQTPEARQNINRAIVEGAEAYRTADEIRMPFPAILVSAIAR